MADNKDKDKDKAPEQASAPDPELTVGVMGTAGGQAGASASGTGPEQSPAMAPVETRPAVRLSEEPESSDTLWVVANDTTGKVAIWERDAIHPVSEQFPDGGEIMVSGDGVPHEVGDTAGVRVAMRDGRLREMGRGEAQKALQEHQRRRVERRRTALAALREQNELANLEAGASR